MRADNLDGSRLDAQYICVLVTVERNSLTCRGRAMRSCWVPHTSITTRPGQIFHMPGRLIRLETVSQFVRLTLRKIERYNDTFAARARMGGTTRSGRSQC